MKKFQRWISIGKNLNVFAARTQANEDSTVDECCNFICTKNIYNGYGGHHDLCDDMRCSPSTHGKNKA
jgi:hypothetical protein